MRMKIRPERPRLPRPPRPRRSNSNSNSTKQHTVSQSRLPRLHSRYISDDDDTDSRRHSIASNLAEDGDNASLSSNLSYSDNNNTNANFLTDWGRIMTDDTVELAKEIREEVEDIRKIITDDNSNRCNYSIASKLAEDGDNQTTLSTEVSVSETGYNCGAFNRCGSNPICCIQEDSADNLRENEQELIQEIDAMKQMMEQQQEPDSSLHVSSDGTLTPPPSPASDGGLIEHNVSNGEGEGQHENGQSAHNTKTTIEGIFQSDYWSDFMQYGSNLCISWNHHERKRNEYDDDSDVVSDITTATPIELSWNDDYCRCDMQFEPMQLLALPTDFRRSGGGDVTKPKRIKSNTGPKQNGKSGHISPIKLPRLKSPLRGGRPNSKPPKAKVIRVKGDDGKNLYQV